MKRYNCVLQLNLSYFRAATHDYDAKSFSTGYLKGPKQPHSAHLRVQVLLSQGIEGGEGPVTPRSRGGGHGGGRYVVVVMGTNRR